MFTDTVTIKCTAGKGGNGVVSWRREKYIPKGGPNGGNGGKGGDILIRCDENVCSLDGYRNHRVLLAERGQQGGQNLCQGKRGAPLLLKVPAGTIVKNILTNEVLFDVTDPKEVYTLCIGGRGGRGNAGFKSPSGRSPAFCTAGKEGETKEIELTLKILADIGLVGLPNAGKSTLINLLTAAKAKCAAYPFTTLIPNIGFIETKDYRRFIIADIPGIIEGAHQNRGLGIRFLKHIERTKVLLFVLDASSEDPEKTYETLRAEIEAYDPQILRKPTMILLNKCDLLPEEEVLSRFENKYGHLPVIRFSAKSGERSAYLTDQLVDLISHS